MYKLFFKKYYPQLILSFVVLLIGITNFESGKWITGWDNLHPEFNLLMNIKRSIFAVWQENQGLGLLGGLGHAAELPRQLILLVMSFFIPVNQLRFFFYMICLFFGALGTYYFLFKYVTNDKKSALLGGLFYIFNLATIQTFYIQYESFIVQFATLPWLFFSITWILKENSRKAWLFFLLISLLSIPQGFVPTLFIVTYGALGLYIFFLLIKQKQYLIRILKIILFTFLLNAFWILPFTYFNFHNLYIVKEAKINQMSSEDLYLKNLKASTFSNAVQLKGFWFDTYDYEKNNNLVPPIMGEWQQYTSQNIIQIINYLLFAIIIYGLIVCFYKKDRQFYYYIFLFLIIFTIFANQQFPFSLPYQIIQKLPLYLEIFRIYFTKLSILAGFSYAVLFSIGLYQLSKKITSFKLELSTYLVIFGLLILSIFPIFQNGLFYSNVRLSIPNEYFQLMDFFAHENPNGRIANLPQHSYVYWNFYNWGYRGSGFLWYGIKQPILDRAFDVWSPGNENYYWELSQAFHAKNITLFNNVIHKYAISWIMVDKNIVIPSNPKSLQYDEIQSFLNKSELISYVKSFGNIDIYTLKKQGLKDYINIQSNLPYVSPKYNWASIDSATQQYGDYISTNNNDLATVFFPFREINGNKNDMTPTYITESDSKFIFSSTIPTSFSGKIIKIPVINYDDIAEFDPNNLTKVILLYPKIYLNNQLLYQLNSDSLKIEKNIQLPLFDSPGIIKVVVPKVKGYNSYESIQDSSFYTRGAESCDTLQSGNIQKAGNMSDGVELLSIDASSCVIQDLPNLNHKSGYVISFKTEHIKGKSLQLQISKLNNKEQLIDNYLSTKLGTNYILLPEQDMYNVGYRILFNNVSIGSDPTINKIFRFAINPIPYSFINSLRVEKTMINASQSVADFEVSHPNSSTYTVKISDQSRAKHITLNQGYDTGWIAFSNGKILDHVLVNNWANAWRLEETPKPADETLREPSTNSSEKANGKSWRGWNNQTVTIIFWPQYLEFLGFGLLIIVLVLVTIL
ncbi:MAG: hypothetical protein AAB441_01560 [Patescibacteria group bacterium]